MEVVNSDDIVFVDGECLLCNRFVNFLVQIDRKQKLHFISLQSPKAKRFLNQFSVDVDMSTVIFYTGNEIHCKSDAVLKILGYMPFPWKMVKGFMVFPKSWLDAIYDLIARKRFHWFGKSNACPIPYSGAEKRFL